MDLFDRLAMMGRRYERRRSVRTGSTRLDLSEVLLLYGRKSIFELETRPHGGESKASKPDVERKLKLSLLDAVSEIHADEGGWYEVFESAPSGDLTKMRLVAYSAKGERTGEAKMLMGRRTAEHYFSEDPIFSLEMPKQA